MNKLRMDLFKMKIGILVYRGMGFSLREKNFYITILLTIVVIFFILLTFR